MVSDFRAPVRISLMTAKPRIRPRPMASDGPGLAPPVIRPRMTGLRVKAIRIRMTATTLVVKSRRSGARRLAKPSAAVRAPPAAMAVYRAPWPAPVAAATPTVRTAAGPMTRGRRCPARIWAIMARPLRAMSFRR
jgi:hypothetical protein